MTEAKASSGPARRGYLILAGLLIAGFVIFYIEGIRQLARRHIEVVALVPDAPAIRVGTDVQVEGVNVGRVRGVEVTKRGDTAYVAIDLSLEPRVRELVTARSDVRASRRQFIGEPVIRLYAGNPGDPPLLDGDTLRGRPQPSPQDLVEQASALPHTLDSLMIEARLVEAHLARAAPRVERLMEQLRITGEAVTAFTATFEGGSLAPMFDEHTGISPRIAALQIRVRELQLAAADAGERYAADGVLVARLDGLAARARAVDTALAELETRMEEGGGILWRAQADPALEVAMRGIQAQVDSLMAEALSIALRMFLP